VEERLIYARRWLVSFIGFILTIPDRDGASS
jgi:hypothetical protein